MRKSVTAVLLSMLIALGAMPAGAGEEAKAPRDLAAEVHELRQEIARLRDQIARLVANLEGTKALTDELLAIARKLEAGEELAAGEIRVLLAAMRSATSMQGRGLAARARGLIRRLPPAQRAKLHAAVLTDLAADGSARDESLRELVAFKDKPARAAIMKALELERLLPAVHSNQWMGAGSFPVRLIRAGIDLEEKGAVDAAVAYCRDMTRNAAERTRTPGGRHGYRIWGRDNQHILRKLAAWSGDEGLLKYTEGGGRGGYEIKTAEAAEAFAAEVEKAAAWWKANREAFKFPAPPPPPEPAAPAPADGPKPATQPKDPEVF